jgi:hypothetical protein
MCSNKKKPRRAYKMNKKAKIKDKLQKAEIQQAKNAKKVMQVFSTSRCSICGGYISEGDEFCSGGHKIGSIY